MTATIKITSQTREAVAAYLEKQWKRKAKRNGIPLPEFECGVEKSAEPFEFVEDLAQVADQRPAPNNIPLIELDTDELSAIQSLVRSIKYQRTIMKLQDGRRENYSDYEGILRKELAELKEMENPVLRGFGLEEAIWKLEGYLLRYNSNVIDDCPY